MNYIPHLQPLLKFFSQPVTVVDIHNVYAINLEEHIDIALADSTGFCIFDTSCEICDNLDQKVAIIQSYLDEKNLEGILFYAGFKNYVTSNLQVVSWPGMLWAFKNQKLPHLNLDPKQFKYSCLNRNPQWFRLLFYTLIKKHKKLNDTIYTFYNQDPYNSRVISPRFYAPNAKNMGPYFELCLKNINDMPIGNTDDSLGKNDHSISHRAYLDAECNIVTESSVEVEFTSEKIWKPIAAGQCFHIVGSVGTNAWLNSLGFETFDVSYDSITNSVTRLEAVVNQLNQESMWTDENLRKIQHNYELFHSGKVEETLLNNCNITQ